MSSLSPSSSSSLIKSSKWSFVFRLRFFAGVESLLLFLTGEEECLASRILFSSTSESSWWWWVSVMRNRRAKWKKDQEHQQGLPSYSSASSSMSGVRPYALPFSFFLWFCLIRSCSAYGTRFDLDRAETALAPMTVTSSLFLFSTSGSVLEIETSLTLRAFCWLCLTRCIVSSEEKQNSVLSQQAE